jgi:hypothetical protein
VTRAIAIPSAMWTLMIISITYREVYPAVYWVMHREMYREIKEKRIPLTPTAKLDRHLTPNSMKKLDRQSHPKRNLL